MRARIARSRRPDCRSSTLGDSLTEADVIAHCKGKIASFKIPRHVRIVADVPRTPGPHGDKVQKAKLRELFLAEPS